MRAIVFVNGQFEDRDEVAQLLREDDYLVAADGGALHCLALGRRPDVVVGDLDSLDADLVEQLAASGTQIERHDVAKNQTDLELAIERAIKDGAEEIWLVAATGGRLDQSLANLLLLAQREWPVKLKVFGNGQLAQVLHSHERLELHDYIGATLSILPLTQQVTGITYQSMAYPLENATLNFGSTRGISNEIVASPASLEIESGMLLVVYEVKRWEDGEGGR
ncbi:MAG: thiamine diphosphokinase [Caldilineaceae bacterium]